MMKKIVINYDYEYLLTWCKINKTLFLKTNKQKYMNKYYEILFSQKQIVVLLKKYQKISKNKDYQ